VRHCVPWELCVGDLMYSPFSVVRFFFHRQTVHFFWVSCVSAYEILVVLSLIFPCVCVCGWSCSCVCVGVCACWWRGACLWVGMCLCLWVGVWLSVYWWFACLGILTIECMLSLYTRMWVLYTSLRAHAHTVSVNVYPHHYAVTIHTHVRTIHTHVSTIHTYVSTRTHSIRKRVCVLVRLCICMCVTENRHCSTNRF
jgi:hypothetical protein